MNYKFSIIIVVFFIFFTSCDNKPKTNKEHPGENNQPESRQFSLDEVLSTELSGWSKHWATFIPDFSVEQFKKAEVNELQPLISDLIPEMQTYRNFREKMVISPDGSMYLDLYSYKIIISSKDGELKGSINPDAEAVIIDPTQEIRNRILFMGPAGGIEDAAWLSNEEIIISGFAVDESGNSSPLIWHINLGDEIITSYLYPAATQYQPEAYLKKVFSQVIFD